MVGQHFPPLLQQVQGFLETLVGFFQFVLQGQVESLFEAEVEGQLGNVLHPFHVSQGAVLHRDFGAPIDS